METLRTSRLRSRRTEALRPRWLAEDPAAGGLCPEFLDEYMDMCACVLFWGVPFWGRCKRKPKGTPQYNFLGPPLTHPMDVSPNRPLKCVVSCLGSQKSNWVKVDGTIAPPCIRICSRYIRPSVLRASNKISNQGSRTSCPWGSKTAIVAAHSRTTRGCV